MNTETRLRSLRAERIGRWARFDSLREVFLRHDRQEAEEELPRAHEESIREMIRTQKAMELQVVDGGE